MRKGGEDQEPLGGEKEGQGKKGPEGGKEGEVRGEKGGGGGG